MVYARPLQVLDSNEVKMEDLFAKLQKQANWGVILVSDKEHVQKTEDQSVKRLQVGVIAPLLSEVPVTSGLPLTTQLLVTVRAAAAPNAGMASCVILPRLS